MYQEPDFGRLSGELSAGIRTEGLWLPLDGDCSWGQGRGSGLDYVPYDGNRECFSWYLRKL